MFHIYFIIKPAVNGLNLTTSLLIPDMDESNRKGGSKINIFNIFYYHPILTKLTISLVVSIKRTFLSLQSYTISISISIE